MLRKETSKTPDGLRPLFVWLTDTASAGSPSALAFSCSPSLYSWGQSLALVTNTTKGVPASPQA